MALQAQQIDIAHPQHVNIRAPMGNMTGRASLHLYRLMLKHKRPLLVGMAGEANGVLRRRGAHLLRPNRAMHIVAIRTLHQSLINAMAKRHFELRLLLQMAGVTKLRLRLHQQKLFGLRMVRRMAGNATDIVLRVDRVNGIHVLRAACVTSHATSVDFLGRSILEHEYFRFVAAAGHMVGAGAMAALAALLRRTALNLSSVVFQCGVFSHPL